MSDDQPNSNSWASSSPPPSPADAAENLEKAITFMIHAYLQKGLIKKGDIVNMLEEVIQHVERETRTDISSKR